MHHTLIARQVALVSYGTKFLRKEVALEDWYRHGIFFGARLQFREPADNALLADDFTWWLGILRAAGAVRLTLHLCSEFDLGTQRATRGGDYAVAVHYPERHELWVVGEERAAWLEHPLLPDDGHYPAFPDASHWGGQLDSYWRMAERPGTLDVPDTNWKQLAAAIAADLDIRVPSSMVPAGPVILPGQEPGSWARFPLFPKSSVAAPAHHLLATLYQERARLSNDMNPKNEGSHYNRLGAEATVQMDNWARRLDSWLIEAQLRCANECRGAVFLDRSPPLVRLHTPIQAPVPAGGDDRPPRAEAAAGAGKWTRRLALVLAIAALSLLVLACARVIAGFPWLSILIGLPVALLGFKAAASARQ